MKAHESAVKAHAEATKVRNSAEKVFAGATTAHKTAVETYAEATRAHESAMKVIHAGATKAHPSAVKQHTVARLQAAAKAEIKASDRGAAWSDGTTARSAVKVHETMEAGGDAGATAKAHWPIKVA